MKVLVVGSGGREHALVWKIKQSPRVTELLAAPGNAGIASIARCVEVSSDDIKGLFDLARSEKVDLTVVGPEAPLTAGLVDKFEEARMRIFGPRSNAAELEGSKVFCKSLLRKHAIPTAGFRVVTSADAAADYLRSVAFPVVIKADGLAAGKGVSICNTYEDAVYVASGMLEKKIFGSAGDKIVIEDHLVGEEASVLACVDGRNLLVLEAAQDHKRALDGDKGPNTGGMGAYSPVPALSEADMKRVIAEILVPTVHAMRKEDRTYKGVLYAGIMLTRQGPKVLEFNVRFGDPETQPIIMRLKSDIIPLLEATIDGKLEACELEWDRRAAVCVVLASGGYPGKYEKGKQILGLTEVAASSNVAVFHAGTTRSGDKTVTSGGRVLGVTGLGQTIAAARDEVYKAVSMISFDGMHYRKDIAVKAMK
ncbi:MAG: phosphoribosylamine--glycine ligase [Planctomycetota bacterium]|nr:phosphoribosylamine--glycine ligase [Planctomycetota bacterium]